MATKPDTPTTFKTKHKWRVDMTKKWYRENKHILDAWAEDKEIEVFISGEWQPVDKNKEFWIEGAKYRIKPEIEYPIYAKRKDYNIWVKFIAEDVFEVIGMKPPTNISEMYGTYVGEIIEHGHPHTNDEIWEIIPNPYELRDKDAILGWNNGDKTIRIVGFWDAEHGGPFSYDGTREGFSYQKYEKMLPWDEPDWVKETRKYLED